jgi:hypothetical protein
MSLLSIARKPRTAPWYAMCEEPPVTAMPPASKTDSVIPTSRTQANATVAALSGLEYTPAPPRRTAAPSATALPAPDHAPVGRVPLPEPMVATFIGQVACPGGRSLQHDEWDRGVPSVLPVAAFRRNHPYHLPLLLHHIDDAQIGVIDHLELADGALVVVGRVVFHDMMDDGWYLCAGSRVTPTSTRIELDDARIDEISLVRKSADVGNNEHAVAWSSVDLAWEAGAEPRGMPPAWRSVWNNAASAMAGRLYHGAPSQLGIAGAPPEPTEPARRETPAALAGKQDRRPGARVRLHGIWLTPEDSATYLKERDGIGWT